MSGTDMSYASGIASQVGGDWIDATRRRVDSFRPWCWAIALLLAIGCGCSGYAAEPEIGTADKAMIEMIERTISSLPRGDGGDSIEWPETLSMFHLHEAESGADRMLIEYGGRWYRVEYWPPHLHDTADVPSPMVLKLYRVRRPGWGFLSWSETYAVRNDGRIVYGQGWQVHKLGELLMVLILASMLALPILVYYARIRMMLVRRRLRE